MSPLDQFLGQCAGEIHRRAGSDDVLQQGSARFSRALEAMTPREHDRTEVPSIAWLDQIAEGPLATAFLAARAELSWIPSPRTSDGGTERSLAPINDVRNLDDVVCGLMLVAPGCNYPEHAHGPQEIYLPIAGDGRWRYGGDPNYRQLEDDALVYNPPRNVHGVRAGGEPLVAIYVLWN